MKISYVIRGFFSVLIRVTKALWDYDCQGYYLAFVHSAVSDLLHLWQTFSIWQYFTSNLNIWWSWYLLKLVSQYIYINPEERSMFAAVTYSWQALSCLFYAGVVLRRLLFVCYNASLSALLWTIFYNMRMLSCCLNWSCYRHMAVYLYFATCRYLQHSSNYKHRALSKQLCK